MMGIVGFFAVLAIAEEFTGEGLTRFSLSTVTILTAQQPKG
jgi:hypothetical protein